MFLSFRDESVNNKINGLFLVYLVHHKSRGSTINVATENS